MSNVGSPDARVNVEEVDRIDVDEVDTPTTVDVPSNEVEEENSTKKRTKKRKSQVWNDFTMIENDDGTRKAVCNHCGMKFAMKVGGPTSTLMRHQKTCVARQVSDKKQKVLALDPVMFDGKSGGPSVYKYDKEKVREIIAKMIIVHEYSFRMVEHTLFNVLLRTLNPRFDTVSRVTIRNDCMKLFTSEKKKLKEILRSVGKICLTTDLWTSNQTIGYMCLTVHFMDMDWKLQKRVISFCGLSPPHTGLAIADAILQCLIEWGIENKVCTVTMDNASANDVAIRNLKDNFSLKGHLYFGGRIFHVRCCAHILNLMVQDGLDEIRSIVENVRESVKYFKMSPVRLHKFAEIVRQLQLSTSRRLILDVPTRWNSTYKMLESALFFKEVFPRYAERDPNYRWLPSTDDWKKAEEFCKFLEVFSEATLSFSGSKYPTSNLFLPEIWKIKKMLNEKSLDERGFMRDMTYKMREKFEKYWGECNLVMAIAAVLDPRYKMKLIEFCFPKIYSSIEAGRHITLVREALYALFYEYVNDTSFVDSAMTSSSYNYDLVAVSGVSKSVAEFDEWATTIDSIEPIKSDLDVYLEEGRLINKGNTNSVKFDALEWWKANTLKFRILSDMARDILSIPISTVASESAFSAGGRVLSKCRSCLKLETVQALICTGDWIRAELDIEKLEESDDEDMQEACFK